MADAICVGKFVVADKKLILELRHPTTGALITSFGSVSIDLADLVGTNKEARFQEIVYQNADCEWKKRWVLCTDEEDAEAPE